MANFFTVFIAGFACGAIAIVGVIVWAVSVDKVENMEQQEWP